MVNTFVPYWDVSRIACTLDYKRLGKQRVEAYQIWRIVTGKNTGKGWVNHPAVCAWRGYSCALAMYTNAMIEEWILRGYKNTMERLPHCKNPRFPWWWGKSEHVLMSHRASLNRKLPSHYTFDNIGEYAEYSYVWPKNKLCLLPETPLHLIAEKISTVQGK
jgi:hypothetical protein